MTSSTDRYFHDELYMMWQTLRRQVPQPLRQQARLEYKLHYLVNLTLTVPQTVWDYSHTLYSLAAAKYFTKEQPRLAYEYACSAAKAATHRARSSLNMTAYQAGSFSARWGLFLNTVSRVSSRVLLGYYEWCQHSKSPETALMNLSLTQPLKHMICAVWLRAKCVYLYAKVLFSYLMYKLEKNSGQGLNTWKWNAQWRHTCCEIFQAKLDIAIHEVAMAGPDMVKSLLFPTSSIVRKLVERRILRGPFPKCPASCNDVFPTNSIPKYHQNLKRSLAKVFKMRV